MSKDLCGDVCGYIRLLLPAHFMIDGGVNGRGTIFVDRTHARTHARIIYIWIWTIELLLRK